MPRPALIAAAALGLLVLGLGLREALRSEEDRVRGALVGGLEAFSEGDVFGCVRRIHADFVHTAPPRVDRATLTRGLVAQIGAHRDPRTAAMNARASVVGDSLVIDVLDDERDAPRADARFELRLEHRATSDGPWEETWRVDVTATFERTTLGWLLREADTTTRAGRPPR